MKESVKATLKKVVVMLIASLMVLGAVPIGMLTLKPQTARAEGEFVRLLPDREAVVWQEEARQDLREEGLYEHILPTGNPCNSYLRFDLRSLYENKNLGELTKASLRLVVLPEKADPSVPIHLYLMKDNDWKSSMTEKTKPSRLGETPIVTFTCENNGRDATVVEVDLTAQMQTWMEEEREIVSFHLFSNEIGLGAVFAGAAFEDEAYRPSLKVVTGKSQDTDTHNLGKSQVLRISQRGTRTNSRTLVCGSGRDVFMKLSLNPDQIQGTMMDARLMLGRVAADEDARIWVYQYPKNSWDDAVSFPRGEETLVHVEEGASVEELGYLDLTYAVNDAYARGETELILRIGCTDGNFFFANQGEAGPFLNVLVTDRDHKAAVIQGTVYALGGNASGDAVFENLPDSYTTERGRKATIRWQATDVKTGKDASDALKKNGTIKRPLWFEEPRQILATAEISCQGYTKKRTYLLSLVPEDMPDFSKEQFSAILQPGKSNAEEAHAFSAVNTEKDGRFVGRHYLSNRVLEKESAMAFCLGTQAAKQNYLTVKLWQEDLPTGTLLVDFPEKERLAPIRIQAPEVWEEKEGFLYLTYPIDQSLTENGNYLALRLSLEEGSETPWPIYGVYITQTPAFDPLSFSKEGEVVAGKEDDRQTSFSERARALFEQIAVRLGIRENQTGFVQNAESQVLWTEGSVPILAFDNRDDRFTVTFLQEEGIARVHRDEADYDLISFAPLFVQDNLLWADFEDYQIFRNLSQTEKSLTEETAALSGVYRDILMDSYWAFLEEGQKADESVLPDGTALEADAPRVPKEGTLILEHLAEPVCGAQWRIAALDDTPASKLSFRQTVTFSEVTVQNVGEGIETGPMQVLCLVYENGRVCGLSGGTFEATADQSRYVVAVDPVSVGKGQTVSIFVEAQPLPLHTLTPRLQLP